MKIISIFSLTLNTNNNQLYIKFCSGIMNTRNKDKEKYYKLCLKLIRNLNIFCSESEDCNTNSIYCINLNSWLYKSIREQELDRKEIYRIFYIIRTVLPKLYKKDMCKYYYYGYYYFEPINIIKLNIFDSNMKIIEETLKKSTYSYTCPYQKYVKVVVEIYKSMEEKYCINSKPKKKAHKYTNICSILKNFSNSYNEYLYKNDLIKNKIPSLASDFTPIGKLLRSRKILKTRRNIFHEHEEKELLYNMHDNMNINLYNKKYDIAYANL
ncbi:variable surface protein [Plasmodium gonderi]|uniref:Variable surface protein n=1 Tax=Plasmodium gonderi TaxID=77519 RepID=A0A1Y1JP75_PLAGO|nr:variable surface protein [Plasmodium gonderi]GAW84040.1 variable surface protein [Plasmodium gonderi]